jgi:hypothetical protein
VFGTAQSPESRFAIMTKWAKKLLNSFSFTSLITHLI